MNNVLIMFKVIDYDKWNLNNEESAGNRRTMGSKEGYVYNKVNKGEGEEVSRTISSAEGDVHYKDEKLNELVVLYKWDNLDQAHEYFESEEFKNTIKDAGIEGNPEIYYLEERTRLIG